MGNRHPLSAPFGVYRARDGHYALAVLNKKLFDATAAAMDLPELASDPRFASDETRSANEPALRAALAKATEAYGPSVARDLGKAIDRLHNRTGWLERCMQAMAMQMPKAVLWQKVRALRRILPEV